MMVQESASLITNEIPVISLKSLVNCSDPNWHGVTDQMDQALTTFTCFFIVDHGIEDELCKKVLQDLTKFFEKPVKEKLIYELKNKNEGRGYVPLFTLNANLYMGRENLPNDAIERFLFGDPDTRISGYNQAPDDCAEGWTPN
uniref:Non-haem dioxygenase N-terminal domain-containing protein n=1 Tax=Romanomermis culicivorax TaxID=13658 RepID=A0A915IF14_ROMCU